jgi:hypothetical protein
VALAKFTNEQGLVKMGGNLFKSTLESGDAITNRPGSNGLGSIAPNSLEQSNVDMATEFVKMISTQRGFQANSKIITRPHPLPPEPTPPTPKNDGCPFRGPGAPATPRTRPRDSNA